MIPSLRFRLAAPLRPSSPLEAPSQPSPPSIFLRRGPLLQRSSFVMTPGPWWCLNCCFWKLFCDHCVNTWIVVPLFSPRAQPFFLLGYPPPSCATPLAADFFLLEKNPPFPFLSLSHGPFCRSICPCSWSRLRLFRKPLRPVS